MTQTISTMYIYYEYIMYFSALYYTASKILTVHCLESLVLIIFVGFLSEVLSSSIYDNGVLSTLLSLGVCARVNYGGCFMYMCVSITTLAAAYLVQSEEAYSFL